jgi:hypothetical protein
MIELNYKEAHDFVTKNSKRGYFWDGYTIVRWVRNDNGYTMKNGMFKNDTWGISFRSEVSNNGTWKVKSV